MTQIADEQVTSYFERYGWKFTRVREGVFRFAFRGEHGAFTAHLRVSANWIVFSINPYIKRPPSGFGPLTLRALAHANQTLPMAKIGIDDDGDAFLAVELPTEGFSYSQFSDSLSAIAYFSNSLILTLLQANSLDTMTSAQDVQ